MKGHPELLLPKDRTVQTIVDPLKIFTSPDGRWASHPHIGAENMGQLFAYPQVAQNIMEHMHGKNGVRIALVQSLYEEGQFHDYPHLDMQSMCTENLPEDRRIMLPEECIALATTLLNKKDNSIFTDQELIDWLQKEFPDLDEQEIFVIMSGVTLTSCVRKSIDHVLTGAYDKTTSGDIAEIPPEFDNVKFVVARDAVCSRDDQQVRHNAILETWEHKHQHRVIVYDHWQDIQMD